MPVNLFVVDLLCKPEPKPAIIIAPTAPTAELVASVGEQLEQVATGIYRQPIVIEEPASSDDRPTFDFSRYHDDNVALFQAGFIDELITHGSAHVINFNED